MDRRKQTTYQRRATEYGGRGQQISAPVENVAPSRITPVKKHRRFRWTRRSLLVVAGLAVLFVGGGATYAQLGPSLTQSSTTGVNLQKGLVGWWKLDGNLNDSSTTRQIGTWFGATSYTADFRNTSSKAASFSGSNYISLTNNNTHNFANNFSVSAWFKSDTFNKQYQTIVSKGDNSWRIQRYSLANTISFDTTRSDGSNHSLQSTKSLNDGVWHQVTAVYDGSLKYLYVDGVLDASVAYTSNVPASTYQTWIGNNNQATSRQWTGAIDDVRLYKRAINSNEVKALFASYNPSTNIGSGEKNLVGWWKLDGNLIDSSPNRNTGTAAGATVTTDRKSKTNSAYAFDTGKGINLPTSNALNSNVFSYSAWVMPTSNSNNRTIVGSTSNDGPQFRLSNGTPQLTRVQASPLAIGTATSSVPLNTWTHVAVTYDASGNYKFYINGVLSGSGTNLFTFTFSNYKIGYRTASSEYFIGSIDDVRIYNRALSQSEVDAQYRSYNAQVTVNSATTNLAALYKLNGNANDSSVQRNNGTVSGATITTDRFGGNGAYSFVNNTDSISVPLSASLQPPTFTYMAWVYPTSFANATSVIGWSSDNGPQLTITTSGQIRLMRQNGAFVNTSLGSIPLNTWTHIAAAYNGSSGSYRFYINGVSDSGGTNAKAFTYSNMYIGRSNTTSQAFKGKIDDVRIYSRYYNIGEVAPVMQLRD